jgi:glycosyltransferase involved in cell wall biosynthesis
VRIAVVANTSWYLLNFRLNLIRALQELGHAVVAVAPSDDHSQRLASSGVSLRHVSISGMGTNPITELRTVLELRSLFRQERVDLVFSYTPKGNLYAALACMADGRAFAPNISGLGRAFIKRGALTHLVRRLYRFCLRRSRRVYFQNSTDRDLFVREHLVPPGLTELLPGSGVDLVHFSVGGGAAGPERTSGGPVFLMVSRALWDKGLGEYVEAARAIRLQRPDARFQLLGPMWPGNPATVPLFQLDSWAGEGILEYLGATQDVRPHLRAADCVVLPSYREGMPRVLLEAAAVGRPVITTDAPGCRDAVVDGETGFVCRVRDAGDLAEAMRRFLALSPDARHDMGARGRAFVEANFDERAVISRYLSLVAEVEKGPAK